MEVFQKTIATAVEFNGVGVHSGESATLKINPALANTGILFCRTDRPSKPTILANAKNITSTQLSTTIGHEPNHVSTVEHLMAALFAMGIDNAYIEVDGPEVPILDGSSLEYMKVFEQVGTKTLSKPRKYYVLKKEIIIEVGKSRIVARPASSLSFDCEIDFGQGFIKKQSLAMAFSRENFLKICNARTFCQLKEWELLKSAGLGKGGSLDNAIVVTEDGVLNEGGLRSDDEFVQHKLLDAIGDFALLGAPLLAHIELQKPGHSINAIFTKTLLDKKDEYLNELEFHQINSKETKKSNVQVAVHA